jgi:hypothetical protein
MSGIPAGVRSAEASSWTSEGWQGRAGTIGEAACLYAGPYGDGEPTALLKSCCYAVSFPLFALKILTQKPRAYLALIVRSQLVDPRRTLHMAEEEEKAKEYFEETRDMLQLFYPCGWMDEFHRRVADFIQERISEAKNIMAIPFKGEEDYACLHGLRRLVAGAYQEGELVRQPNYACTWAKLGKEIVWDGRGYVFDAYSINFLAHSLHRINLNQFRKRYGW